MLHVFKNNDNMEVHANQDTVDSKLSRCLPTDVIIVKNVDYIERGTVVYGNLSGGLPLPPSPPNVITTDVKTIKHVSKK